MNKVHVKINRSRAGGIPIFVTTCDCCPTHDDRSYFHQTALGRARAHALEMHSEVDVWYRRKWLSGV